MKRITPILLSAFLAFFFAQPVIAASEAPQQMEFYYGNAMFGDETYSLKDGVLTYTTRGPDGKKTETLAVTDAQWKQLRADLEVLKIWNWKPEYMGSVNDGTQWRVKLQYADRSIDAKGSNAYPGADGSYQLASEDSSSPTTEYFEKVVAAFRRLAGK